MRRRIPISSAFLLLLLGAGILCATSVGVTFPVAVFFFCSLLLITTAVFLWLLSLCYTHFLAPLFLCAPPGHTDHPAHGTERATLHLLAEASHEKAKWEAVLASIADGVILIDTHLNITFFNRAAEKMLGYTATEVLGKNVFFVVRMQYEDGKEIPVAERALTRVVEKNEIVQTTLGNYYVRKDETRFPISYASSPVMLKGKNLGAIVVFSDVTKEKEIDQQKTEFVSLASHQLKTPLGALNWDLEMLMAGDYGKLKPEQQEVVAEMETLVKRMNELVNGLLNVSRIELGVFLIEPVPTNIAALCEEVLKELEPRLIAKKHTLTKDIDATLTTYNADPKLLRIVFQNFLSNAIKYTQDAGKIGVTLKMIGGKLVFRVANNGEPIPAPDQKKIFSKMFRASNANKQDADGNGLGLYLVKKIVENGGGKVGFTSRLGEDTVFTAEFPKSGMKKKVGTKALS